MAYLDNLVSSGKKRKRVGRGGSRGGTSGKGHKGQKARSGGTVRRGFEGGQMPLYRRLPKRGFTNARFKPETIIVNLSSLDKAFNEGDTVTMGQLIERKVIKVKKGKEQTKTKYMIKLLGEGEISKKLTVQLDAISKSAAQAIEKAGGSVQLTREM